MDNKESNQINPIAIIDTINQTHKKRNNQKRMAIPIIYNGKYYKSKYALAKAYGITPSKLSYRLKKGYSIEEAIAGNMNSKYSITYEGKKYKSKKALAEAYNINPIIFYKNLKEGLSIKEAVEEAVKWKDGITYKGNHFKTKKELAKAYRIDYQNFCKDLKEGLSIQEAIENGKPRKDKLGKRKPKLYPLYIRMDVLEFSESNGYKPRIVQKLINNGWTFEEILKSSLGKI